MMRNLQDGSIFAISPLGMRELRAAHIQLRRCTYFPANEPLALRLATRQALNKIAQPFIKCNSASVGRGWLGAFALVVIRCDSKEPTSIVLSHWEGKWQIKRVGGVGLIDSIALQRLHIPAIDADFMIADMH